jgi:hypothetical protein
MEQLEHFIELWTDECEKTKAQTEVPEYMDPLSIYEL